MRLVPRLGFLCLTIALGLASRAHRFGSIYADKYPGDILYAIASYLLVSILFRRKPSQSGALAAAYCILIELFKFTGIPKSNSRLLIVRLVFGTTPAWQNVVCYAVGIILATVLDAMTWTHLGKELASPASSPSP